MKVRLFVTEPQRHRLPAHTDTSSELRPSPAPGLEECFERSNIHHLLEFTLCFYICQVYLTEKEVLYTVIDGPIRASER